MVDTVVEKGRSVLTASVENLNLPGPLVKNIDTRVVGPKPKPSVLIFRQTGKINRIECILAGEIRLVNDSAVSVETVQSIVGGDPDVAFTVLNKRFQIVGGET
jgi:hypothetical protein